MILSRQITLNFKENRKKDQMKRGLDAIDKRILGELQSNGRLPIVELARRVFLTKTPCAERVKRLERSGFIEGYRAQLNPDKLNAGLLIVVHVTLSKTSADALDKFNEAVKHIPQVQSCFLLASQFDYMLKVRTSDINHYRNVLGDLIGNLPGVQQTHSYVAMEIIKDDPAIPLQY